VAVAVAFGIYKSDIDSQIGMDEAREYMMKNLDTKYGIEFNLTSIELNYPSNSVETSISRSKSPIGYIGHFEYKDKSYIITCDMHGEDMRDNFDEQLTE
jgi:hypothetical protein